MLTFFRNLFAPPRHLILLVIATWIGLILAEKRSERHGISKSDLSNLVFYGVIAFLLGGRITFALQNIPAFANSPLDVFSMNPDLFDPFGGLAVALITGFIYGQRHGLQLWPALDALTPLFAIMAVGLSLSHLAAGTAFGSPTNVPWGIDLWNATRHPTQLYEVLASILIFAWIWFKRPDPRPGLLFLTFGSLTAGAQLFIQAFRGDSALILNGLKQEQAFDWIALLIFFVLIEVRIGTIKSASQVKAAVPKRASRTKS